MTNGVNTYLQSSFGQLQVFVELSRKGKHTRNEDGVAASVMKQVVNPYVWLDPCVPFTASYILMLNANIPERVCS